MKQTTKTLVNAAVLVAVAGALGLAAVWVGKDEEKKTAEKEKSAKLFELDKAKLRELKVVKAGQLVAAFKRDAQDKPWRIVEPLLTDADDASVAAMVDKLAELKQKSEIEGLDGKGVGLGDEKTAKLVVTAVEEGGKASVLWIGEENPFDASLYVKRGGEATVRVASAGDKAPFDKPLFDLRDKRVARLDEAAEVKKVEVTPSAALPVKGAALLAGAFAYAMEKEGNNWRLLAPAPGGADGATVDRVISAVRGLRATAVAAEKADEAQLKEYGLAFPKVAVALTVAVPGGKDTFVRKVLIGQPPPAKGQVTAKTFARRDDSPTVFEVDGQIVKDLAKELFDLQDKTVLKLDREAVRAVVYQTPGQPEVRVLRKKEAPPDGGTAEEAFEVASPKAGAAKKWKLSGNLYALSQLKAAAFGEAPPKDGKALAKLGLDRPRTVTVLGEKDAVLGKLWVGAETGTEKKRYFALVEGFGRVLEIEKATIDDLGWRPDDVLEAPPPPPAPAQPLPDGGAK